MFKEFEYELSKDCPYKGKVKVKILPFVQRNELVKKVNFKLDQSTAKLSDNIDASNRLADVVRENVLSMSVSRGKHDFKSLEELDYDVHAGEFYTEVGLVICRGIDLGKT